MKSDQLARDIIRILDIKAREGARDPDNAWAGFENPEGVDIGQDIELLIGKAKAIIGKATKPDRRLLFRLTEEEYAEGAQLALQSAKEFLSVSESCRDKGFFAKGAASSVFCLEELAKAAYLQLKALNPHISISNLDSYFHKHGVKHYGITQMVAALDTDASDDPEQSGNPPLKSEHTIGFAAILLILLVIFLLVHKNDSDQPLEWADDPNDWLNDDEQLYENIRQRGLYVEFNQKTRAWTGPNDALNEYLFEMVFQRAQRSLSVVEKYLFDKDASADWAVEIAEALADERITTRDARQWLDSKKLSAD